MNIATFLQLGAQQGQSKVTIPPQRSAERNPHREMKREYPDVQDNEGPANRMEDEYRQPS